MPTKIETMTNKYNSTIKVFINSDINTLDNVLNLNTLNSFYDNMHSNLSKYYGNFFNGLNMEVWDDACLDLPVNKSIYDATANTNRIISYGIGNYSGLTWAGNSLVQLNDNLFGQSESVRNFHMSNLFSHEVGHWIASKCLKFDTETIFKRKWNEIRGIHAKSSTPAGELIAEDIRLLFGSDLARGHKRGDYIQATDVRGLKEFYLIWSPALTYMNAYSDIANIKNIQFLNYNSEVIFDIDHHNFLLKVFNRRIKINTSGIYILNWNGSWSPQKLFA